MTLCLALAFAFAILTLWIPAQWPVAAFQLTIFALASASVASWIRNPPRFSYPFVPLSLACLLGLAQLLASRTSNAFETQRAVVNWLTLLAVFAIGYTLFQQSSARNWFRLSMMWFACGVALLAILQSFTAGGRIFWLFPSEFSGSHNVMGPILYRNHFAAFVEIVLPIAVYEAVSRRSDSLRYSAAAAILYTSVIVSASRAGAAIATIEIAVVAWLAWRASRLTSRPVAPALMKLAAVLALFTVIAGWSALSSRMYEPDLFTMRREFALSSLQMISSQPLTGVGLGNWPVVYPHYAVIDFGVFANRAHSDWLEWTAEGGVPLGIAMLTLLVWAVRPAIRTIWGLGVIAVFVHAAVDYPFSRPALEAWITIVIAMLAAINCHSLTNSNNRTTNSSHPASVS